jgi:hypothetical protein
VAGLAAKLRCRGAGNRLLAVRTPSIGFIVALVASFTCLYARIPRVGGYRRDIGEEDNNREKAEKQNYLLHEHPPCIISVQVAAYIPEQKELATIT